MAISPQSAQGPKTLMATRRALLALAPVVRWGLLVLGLGLALDRAQDLVSDVQLTWGERVVLGILLIVYGGGFALAGWVVGRLFQALGEVIGVIVDQSDSAKRTADLLERRVAPTLERLAVAFERSAAGSAAQSPSQSPNQARDDGRAIAVAGVRQAIDDGRWDRAERLVQALARDYPEAPETSSLADEVAEGRRQAINDLQARIEASKQANDPEQVIAYRDELTLHLRGDDLKQLDKQLVGWLMGLIQRRMRAGSVQPDVAELASKVADSFGDTAEGASLRAALPTLRRSAGLCPRCAQPYRGVADACPDCLGPAASAVDAHFDSETSEWEDQR